MGEDAVQLVYTAIDELNAESDKGGAIQKLPETCLLGGDGGIDSLMFVNLVVAIEDQIRRKYGRSVTLVSEDTMLLEENPFHTVGTLTAYIEKILAKQVEK